MNNNPDKHNNQEETGNVFFPPKLTSAISLLLKIKPDDPLAQEYLKQKKIYDANFQNFIQKFPQKTEPILSDLNPKDIDINSLYQTFKDAYKFFRRIEFNENLNKKAGDKYGEGGQLARTICSYLLKHKSFFESPLLNSEFNEPSFDKGILLVGKMGTGKTSIMKTFYEMFLFSNSNPLGVLDKNENWQYLKRYKLGFKFFNTQDVVQDYHSCAKDKIKDHIDVFWKKHSSGTNYYDDFLAEKQAFGKDELFAEILETRYNKGCKTWASINYVGKEDESGNYIENIDSTLDAYASRYGERLYDRSFSMYNFIELNGKSLRK